MNPNRKSPASATIRPLAAIPNKQGALIIGVDTKGREALLTVFLDPSGFYTVEGYKQLVGWRYPP